MGSDHLQHGGLRDHINFNIVAYENNMGFYGFNMASYGGGGGSGWVGGRVGGWAEVKRNYILHLPMSV